VPFFYIRMFQNRYRYLFAALLAVYTFLSTEFCDLYHYFGIDIDWYFALLTISAITLATMEISRLMEPAFRKRFKEDRSGIRWHLYFFLATGLVSTVFTTVCVLLVGNVLHAYPLSANSIPLKLNLIYAWLVNLLFHLLNTVIYYFREYRTTYMKTVVLQRLNREAELQMMRQQINPHFLFNNLNVLSSLVLQQNGDANRFIEEFSNLYRYILQCGEQDMVPVGVEMRHIQSYIYLLQKRFEKGLEVTYDLSAGNTNARIVPASVQLLVENAIKHNIVSRSKPLHIRIYETPDQQLAVSNNRQPRLDPEPSQGIGLQHIRKRYGMVTEREVVIAEDRQQFTVKLPLIHLN
jgi:two-component system LytT family sensor kinase